MDMVECSGTRRTGTQPHCVSNPKQEEEERINTSDLFTRHFKKRELQSNNKIYVFCNYCRYKDVWSEKECYKNLKSHLESKHAEEIVTEQRQSQSNGFASNSPHLFNRVRFGYTVAEAVCIDNLSFQFGEYQGFNEVMADVQPSFEMIPERTLKRNAIKVYKRRKHALIDFFGKNDIHVSIVCDIWSDQENMRSFIGITCHFFDESCLNQRVLAFRQFDESDVEMNLCKTICYILEEYKLTNRVFSISFHNVSADMFPINDLNLVCQPLFEGNFFHLKSAFHVLSGCVQDGLRVMVDLVKPVRDVCQHTWAYTDVCRVWMDFCEQNDVYPYRFSYAIGYSWSFTYKLLCQSAEYKNVLFKFAIEHVPDFSVTEEVWDRIWNGCSEIMELFNILYDASRTFCSVYQSSSHLFCLEALNIAGALKDGAKIAEIHEVITQMKMKWLEHYEIIPEIFLVACVFDPRLKLQGLEHLSEEYYELLELRNDVGGVISRVRSKIDSLCSHFHVGLELNLDIPYSKLPMGKRYLEERTKRLRCTSSNVELDYYLTTFFEFGDNSTDFDVLDWWKQHRIMFPTLAKVAFQILAVPVTSVAVEQSFGEAGNVLDRERSNLRSELLEAQICINDWKRAELKAQRNAVSSSSADEWIDPETSDSD